MALPAWIRSNYLAWIIGIAVDLKHGNVLLFDILIAALMIKKLAGIWALLKHLVYLVSSPVARYGKGSS
jgi:hypothetical protein